MDFMAQRFRLLPFTWSTQHGSMGLGFTRASICLFFFSVGVIAFRLVLMFTFKCGGRVLLVILKL